MKNAWKNTQANSGLRSAIEFYASLPDADCHILDTVIPNWTYLDVSFQIYATPNVMLGLGYLEKSQYHPSEFGRNKWEVYCGM